MQKRENNFSQFVDKVHKTYAWVESFAPCVPCTVVLSFDCLVSWCKIEYISVYSALQNLGVCWDSLWFCNGRSRGPQSSFWSEARHQHCTWCVWWSWRDLLQFEQWCFFVCHWFLILEIGFQNSICRKNTHAQKAVCKYKSTHSNMTEK